MVIWDYGKIALLVSATIVFLVALYGYILRNWKNKAFAIEYPYLHSLDSRLVSDEMLIKYELPIGDKVLLNILDKNQKILFTLVDDQKEKGTYEVSFNSAEIDKGTYYYQLVTSNQKSTKRFEKV